MMAMGWSHNTIAHTSSFYDVVTGDSRDIAEALYVIRWRI